MELAEQLVSLVDRLESWYPEYDLSVVRASDHICLAYIEACRASLASPTSRSKRKLVHAVWAKIDVDDRWELEELAFWQTDGHRIKSLLSLATTGEFCQTGSGASSPTGCSSTVTFCRSASHTHTVDAQWTRTSDLCDHLPSLLLTHRDDIRRPGDAGWTVLKTEQALYLKSLKCLAFHKRLRRTRQHRFDGNLPPRLLIFQNRIPCSKMSSLARKLAEAQSH